MSTATLSKHPSRYPKGYPTMLDGGDGAKVWRYRSNGCWDTYVDWCQGLGGAGILGHNGVWSANGRDGRSGWAFHLPCSDQDIAETELIEAIDRHWAQAVHWMVNGTDATNGAIRLARAVTGRENIIAFEGAYHGDSADWCIQGKPPARGVTRSVPPRFVPWNKPAALKDALACLPAAVIFEVGAVDPTPEFVAALNAVGNCGALLIADEVVTGFRLAFGGASAVYGINPDLACFGKAMGSGFPVSAIVGRKELLRELDPEYTSNPVFCSVTHSGNVMGMQMVRETIQRIRECNAFDHIGKLGKSLILAFEVSFANGFAVGQNERSGFRFKDHQGITGTQWLYWYMLRMSQLGHLFTNTNNPTAAHTYGGLEAAVQNMQTLAEQQKSIDKVTWDCPAPLYVRPL